jgi:glycosyltransferase involved in cell wall biosynthesis
LDLKKWSVPANPGIASLLKSTGDVNLLHVGRLAPNKCVEDILKIFYFYHHKIQRRSKLWLIGIDIDTEIYSFELRRLISRFNLKHAVEFVGAVADSELRSFYENSAVYLCMSEHEGFCLPLLEAMHFRLPVIAFGVCAVPETLGEAGILVRRKAHAELAELVEILVSDQGIREKLVLAGQRRIEEFSEERFGRLLQESFIVQLPQGMSPARESSAEGHGHRHRS